MKSIQPVTAKPVRTVELHFAYVREGNTDENFVVIPPKKHRKLESVEFLDVKLIRRTMTTENQKNPYELIQAADPNTGIPPYTLGDPNNSSGVGDVRPFLPCS